MDEDVVTTGVDELLHYLRGKDKVALQDVATALNIPQDTIQAWVDFLVEEKILGVEYKFTKPYIYLNHEEKPDRGRLIEGTTISLEELKKEYQQRALAKQIPQVKIKELWIARVQEALLLKREYFLEQARRRNAENPEEVWQEYRQDLLARCQ